MKLTISKTSVVPSRTQRCLCAMGLFGGRKVVNNDVVADSEILSEQGSKNSDVRASIATEATETNILPFDLFA